MTVEVMIAISSKKLEGLIDTVRYPLPSKLRDQDRVKYSIPALCVEWKKQEDWMSWKKITVYPVQTMKIPGGTQCCFQGQ